MPDAERYARDKARAGALGTTPYRRRVARAEKHSSGISRRQAAGHPGPDEVHVSRMGREWTALPGQPITRGSRAASRMGSLASDIGRLKGHRITPEEFDQRWGGKRIGGYEVPSAAEALAHGREQGPSPDRPYRRLTIAATP